MVRHMNRHVLFLTNIFLSLFLVKCIRSVPVYFAECVHDSMSVRDLWTRDIQYIVLR